MGWIAPTTRKGPVNLGLSVLKGLGLFQPDTNQINLNGLINARPRNGVGVTAWSRNVCRYAQIRATLMRTGRTKGVERSSRDVRVSRPNVECLAPVQCFSLHYCMLASFGRPSCLGPPRRRT